MTGLVLFLLLLTPGLLYESLWEQRRPTLQLTGFRETARVALASAVFSSAALGLAGLLRCVRPAWVVDPHRLLDDTHRYTVERLALVSRTGAAIVLLSWLLAALCYFVLTHTPAARGRLGAMRPHDTLWTVLHESTTGPAQPRVELRTVDGASFRGNLVAHDPSGSRGDRFIALGPPLFLQNEQGESVPVSDPWSRLVLPMESVTQIWIGFVAAPPKRRCRMRRKG